MGNGKNKFNRLRKGKETQLMKLFNPGKIVISEDIGNAITSDEKFANFVFSSLKKHLLALKNRCKPLSTYETDEFRKILIVAAEDQSQTAVVFSQVSLDGIIYAAIG